MMGRTPPPAGSPAASDAPEIVRPPEGSPRFPLVDGLRGIAVLAVVAYHSSGLWPANEHRWFGPVAARLEMGVAIFFVISGFLLYRPFVAARVNGTPAPALIVYLRRRALRILPGYWVALTLLTVYPGLQQVFSGHWWVYYGLLQVYHQQWYEDFQGLLVAWSLCAEVAFYLALPLLAAAFSRLGAALGRRGPAPELLALLGLGGASVALHAHAPLRSSGLTGLHTLPGTFAWFALGMGLAVTSVHLGPRPAGLAGALGRRPLACWGAAVLLFVLCAQVGGYAQPSDSSAEAVIRFTLYGAVAALVVLPAVLGAGEGGLPRRILASPPLARLGLVSYGVYLYHLPIVFELQDHGIRSPAIDFVLALTLATACATASYVAVERPFLRLKRTGDRRPARSLATGRSSAGG